MGGEVTVAHLDDQLASSGLTLVLVGKTGNGKSATGNSILGTKSFESKRSSSGVTLTSELKTTQLEDGRILNVIDTPGTFDSSADPAFIRKEIVSCIHMAKGGVHAVLVVFSICGRFSEEEQAVVTSLVALFGSKIYDYMIIVFTSGDELEAEGNNFEGFLCGCSEQLKETLRLCGNRCVLFDNNTEDEVKKATQVEELLSCVNMILEKNDRKPYTSERFDMFQKKFFENESLMLTDGRQLKPLLEPGSLFEGDCEFSSTQTIVLVGRKGNGKSATGNSVLGTNIFKSERSSSGVTTICQLNSTKLEDDRRINVIDTPGIGCSGNADFTAKEIIKCIDMAGDGINAFLVVLSIRNRFSTEEEAAISSLVECFGRKFYDYMILVFTGGDQLDEGESLEDFLHDCPEKLKEILNQCENRCVLFDNKTKDQTKRSDQVDKLFSIVDMVSRKNGGKLYNNEMYTEWKKEARELEKRAEISHASKEPKWSTELEISEMIEPKLRETTMIFQRRLAEEHAARLKAEEDAKATQQKSVEQIRYMKEQIEMAKERQKVVRVVDFCVIL